MCPYRRVQKPVAFGMVRKLSGYFKLLGWKWGRIIFLTKTTTNNSSMKANFSLNSVCQDAGNHLTSVRRDWWPISYQIHLKVSIVENCLAKISLGTAYTLSHILHYFYQNCIHLPSASVFSTKWILRRSFLEKNITVTNAIVSFSSSNILASR